MSIKHPDLASEQAYLNRIEAAHEEHVRMVSQGPEMAADPKAAAALYRRKLRFEDVDHDSLCFGRIDPDGKGPLYIGRRAVHENGHRLLVINWRQKVAEPFYEASAADPMGLSLRRRFQLDHMRLLGIVDDVFEEKSPAEPTEHELEGQGPTPQLVDAILSEMERGRSAAMRDIVATIEAEQYRLISAAIDGLLIIQGGPGTGKTAIALHRAAMLLYRHRDELERDGVLVVGPNRTFIDYVAEVLPSLGEMSVIQQAVDNLVVLRRRDANNRLIEFQVAVRGTDTVEAARLKGDLRMVDAMRTALRARARVPGSEVKVTADRTQIVLPAADVQDLIDRAWAEEPRYLEGRERFLRAFETTVRARIPPSRGVFRGGPSDEDVAAAAREAADRVWPTVTAPEVLRDLLGSRERLREALPWLEEADYDLLYRRRQRLLRDEPWTSADLPLLDEVEMQLRPAAAKYFGYVIADEAQDLTPMQLRMVLRRSQTGRGTLVGDLAQATGPWRFTTWEELVDASGSEASRRIAELGISYRVPRGAMDLAAGLLPRIVPDLLVPQAVRDEAEPPRVVRIGVEGRLAALASEVAARQEEGRTLGVIVPAASRSDVSAALAAAGIVVGDIETDGLQKSTTLLTAGQAKGLEFDHVIVFEPADMAGEGKDWSYVYVALTRGTRSLVVLHSTPEPFERPAPADDADLPAATTDAAPDTEQVEEIDVLESAQPAGELARPPATTETLPPVTPVASTPLGARYTEALMQAKFWHDGQTRRGSIAPYFAHLQSVSSLVLEDGGTEDEAIAALLHDAVEERGADILDTIERQFGTRVAQIVAGCTDPPAAGFPSWHDQKEAHLDALRSAGPLVRRVALAEKLDNARALMRDYRRFRDRVWELMDVDPEELLWYYGELAGLFETERPGDMASELRDTVERLLDLASEPVSR